VYERVMRIRTDGKFAYREALVDDVAEQPVEHEDMTEELAEILSTRIVDVEYEVSTGVSVHE